MIACFAICVCSIFRVKYCVSKRHSSIFVDQRITIRIHQRNRYGARSYLIRQNGNGRVCADVTQDIARTGVVLPVYLNDLLRRTSGNFPAFDCFPGHVRRQLHALQRAKVSTVLECSIRGRAIPIVGRYASVVILNTKAQFVVNRLKHSLYRVVLVK